MKITNQQIFAMQEIAQRLDKKNTSENEDFATTLKKASKEEQKNIEKSVTNSDVDNFIEKLTTMGASAFWLQFNYDKIQEKIDKKRLELMEQLGLNEENLEEEEKESAMGELEKMLQDYIKELSEMAKARKELENPNANLQALLNI